MQLGLNEQTKEFIKEINQRIGEHEVEVKSLVQLRAALQNVCKHEFEVEGRDHNYEYEMCVWCGMKRKKED